MQDCTKSKSNSRGENLQLELQSERPQQSGAGRWQQAHSRECWVVSPSSAKVWKSKEKQEHTQVSRMQQSLMEKRLKQNSQVGEARSFSQLSGWWQCGCGDTMAKWFQSGAIHEARAKNDAPVGSLAGVFHAAMMTSMMTKLYWSGLGKFRRCISEKRSKFWARPATYMYYVVVYDLKTVCTRTEMRR